jgi:hypothetical protein
MNTTNYSPSLSDSVQENNSFVVSSSTLNAWWLLLGLISTLIVFIWLRNNFILTPDVYYRFLSERLPAERIEAFMEMRSQRWWIAFISPFLIIPIKTGFTALCITVGVIITGQNVSLTKVFRIALLAESVFLFALGFHIFCGIFVIHVRVPDDFANFAPLSALQFFDPAQLKLWMKHPLRTLNLFEVAYMLVLAYFLTPLLATRKGETSFVRTLGVVASSYGLGLLLWVVVLAFLLLQVS